MEARHDDTLQLIELSGKGDQTAFQRLLEHHAWRLMMLVRRKGGRALAADCDAEDILQQVFSRSWMLLPKYHYEGPGSFYRWLATLAIHAIHDRLRYLDAKGRGDVRHLESLADGNSESSLAPLDQATTAATLAANRERANRLGDALDKLPLELREVVERHVLEGSSFAEVAESLGICKTAVFERLGRGLRLLRRMVGPLEEPSHVEGG
ncbi:MAG: RNA polymerase sigma factor [Planctomycetota bacterium]